MFNLTGHQGIQIKMVLPLRDWKNINIYALETEKYGERIGATSWVFLGDSWIMTQDDEYKNIYGSICHYYNMLEHFKCPKIGE